MRRQHETPARGPRVTAVLTAAALAAATAMVWGGITAVATVNTVNAGARASQMPPSSQPAGLPPGADASQVPPSAQPAGPLDGGQTGQAAAKNAPPKAGTPKLGPIPPAKAGKGAGDSAEVSLAEAARTASGPAARAKAGSDHSSTLKRRGPVDPSDVLADSSQSLGGCLPQYGSDGQCLPVVPPSLSRHLKDMVDAGQDPASMPHSWSCTEVRQYFKNGLAVRQANVDPQKLDANRDGIACGPAD